VVSGRCAALPALAVAACLSGAVDARSQAMPSAAAQRFVGAWRYVGTTIDGVAKPRGNDPKGMIYYGPHGEMAVQIAPDVERKKAGAVMTADEAKIAVTNYVAYFGTYTIDETAQIVTHHRASSLQPGDAAAVVRRYEFVGDRLILRPPSSTQEITWERIK
jgi:hypothetical protein